MTDEAVKIIVPGSEWREEVLSELKRLTEDLVRLRRFLVSEDFYKLSEQQCNLLRNQSTAMSQYADILTKRLQSN
jgi:hypothetical protein